MLLLLPSLANFLKRFCMGYKSFYIALTALPVGFCKVMCTVIAKVLNYFIVL